MPASNPVELEGWMSEAIRLAARAAEEGEVPVGCVVVHRGRIVGRGYNLREKTQNPTAHAEIMAIVEAARTLGSWRLTDCVLIVTLEPCPMCLAACQQARVDRVYYGAKDPKGGAISLEFPLHRDTRLNHRFDVELIETSECGRMLSGFFAERRQQQESPVPGKKAKQ